jgi:hypothetical protein
MMTIEKLQDELLQKYFEKKISIDLTKYLHGHWNYNEVNDGKTEKGNC